MVQAVVGRDSQDPAAFAERSGPGPGLLARDRGWHPRRRLGPGDFSAGSEIKHRISPMGALARREGAVQRAVIHDYAELAGEGPPRRVL